MEVGLKYVLEGAGARVAFNDRSDPDFVGFLDGDDGLAGMSAAEHRSSGEDRVEGEGGTTGVTLRGRRPVALKGFIDPELPGQAAIVSRIKRASRGLRSDSWFTWTPSDGGYARMLALRRQARPVIAENRRPKQFLLPMICPSHLVLSASEFQQQITPDATGGESGFADLFGDLFDSDLAAAGQVQVVNEGDDDAPVRFRIDGPMLNPLMRNETTGQEWRIKYNLGLGEFLIVRRGIVLLNGTTDFYDVYDRGASRWWDLAPGANDVRVLPSNYSAGASVTIFWRHSWE